MEKPLCRAYSSGTSKCISERILQLNNVRHRTGMKEKLHFDLVTLVYNSSKLAVDRINKQIEKLQIQAA